MIEVALALAGWTTGPKLISTHQIATTPPPVVVVASGVTDTPSPVTSEAPPAADCVPQPFPATGCYEPVPAYVPGTYNHDGPDDWALVSESTGHIHVAPVGDVALSPPDPAGVAALETDGGEVTVPGTCGDLFTGCHVVLDVNESYEDQ